MENEKLAQAVKELRKGKGLSQEELAKNSGLALRTIQRLENRETTPTGETLKRIATVLELTPNELIDWDTKKEILKKTLKTKYEYLHIFDNKLVISKTEEINDLVEDYGKSVNNMFKTLLANFISILIFTILAVVFYNLENIGFVIFTGSIAFLFFVGAVYAILFTSGSSFIKMENVSKIIMKKQSTLNVLVISHRESGRLKDRYIILEKNQVDSLKETLLLENLIDAENIKLKTNLFSLQNFITTFIMIIMSYMMFFKKAHQIGFYYGALTGFISVVLIVRMIRKSINSTPSKTVNQ